MHGQLTVSPSSPLFSPITVAKAVVSPVIAQWFSQWFSSGALWRNARLSQWVPAPLVVTFQPSGQEALPFSKWWLARFWGWKGRLGVRRPQPWVTARLSLPPVGPPVIINTACLLFGCLSVRLDEQCNNSNVDSQEASQLK